MWSRSIDLNKLFASDSVDLPGPPDLIFLFGDTASLRERPLPEKLLATFPGAVQIGCSTGTVVDNGSLRDEGVTALAVGFEDTNVRLAQCTLHDPAASYDAGTALADQLTAPDLAGVFVLSDGLSVNGSALVHGLRARLGTHVAISGGLAGDGPRFEQTLVTTSSQCSSGIVAAVGFYGDSIRITHGSLGGWDEFGPRRGITRSDGAVLYELDGRPALDLYESYLGEEAAGLPAMGLLYPLKIWDPESPGDALVRTILAVDHEHRSMIFAGDIPVGWSARLMRGTFDNLIEGARAAAARARTAMEDLHRDPQLCLLVSCVGRRLLMGQDTEDELNAVAQALGDLPIAGFYSYGEIAPHDHSGVPMLHNQTLTLTLLSEDGGR